MFSLAIDGPSASGKSTTSKEIAKKLDFLYIDTGAIYRGIGFYILENHIDINNKEKIHEAIKAIEIDLIIKESKTIVLLNNKDVSKKIRNEKVSMAASFISAYSFVRDFLLKFQRKFVKDYNVVMDGRDVGTKIIPDATMKIFLTASLEERAKRRFIQLKEKNHNLTYEEVLKNIKERDNNDKNRSISPLKPANDAILFDNTKLSFEETIESIIFLFKKKINYGSAL